MGDETRLSEIERTTEKWRFSGRIEMTTQEARALIDATKALMDLRMCYDLAIPSATLEKLKWLGERL